jgi:hypothetical protein
MSNSSIATFARATALAAILLVPAVSAFADDGAINAQANATAPRQQAQAFTDSAGSIGSTYHLLRNADGDNPYVTEHVQVNGPVNEPDFASPEYISK